MRRLVLFVAVSLSGCVANDNDTKSAPRFFVLDGVSSGPSAKKLQPSPQLKRRASAIQTQAVVEPPAPVEPDTRCEAVGRYAGTIGRLRDSGFSKTNLMKLDSPHLANDTFPMREIQDDIYNRPAIPAEELAKRHRGLCNDVGYQNFKARLILEESLRLQK